LAGEVLAGGAAAAGGLSFRRHLVESLAKRRDPDVDLARCAIEGGLHVGVEPRRVARTRGLLFATGQNHEQKGDRPHAPNVAILPVSSSVHSHVRTPLVLAALLSFPALAHDDG